MSSPLRLYIYSGTDGLGFFRVVKLIKNWRSHPAILQFPNERFYNGELESCGDPAVVNSLLRWDGLTNPKFPIIFHSISGMLFLLIAYNMLIIECLGKDEREASSPSFFNRSEASQVKEYVNDLLSDNFRLSTFHFFPPRLALLIAMKHSGRPHRRDCTVQRAVCQDSANSS